MVSRPIALLTSLAGAVLLAVPAQVHAGGPDFGPDPAEIRQAQKLAATLRGAGGIDRAFRVLCRADESTPRHDAAVTVLVERATAAMPRLLDAMAVDAACTEEASSVAVAAVCWGRNTDIYEIDHRSEATVDRSRTAAQQAVLGALGKPGARRSAAVEILLRARRASLQASEGCDASADLVRLATPALVKLLTTKQQEDEILQLFALGGGEPAAAGPAVRVYLGDKKRLPLATLALARMGQDASQAAAPLGELLEGPDVEVALDALQAIGPGARGVLPRLAALSKRMDRTCTKPVEASRLVKAMAAIATRPEDAAITRDAISPLLRCPSSVTAIARALGRQGPEGRDVLLKYLRDEDHTIGNRLDVVEAMQQAGASFDGDDQALVRALRTKAARFNQPVPQVQMPEPDPMTTAGEEFTACRAEAGLKPVAVTGISAEQASKARWCLQSYLCGPSRSTAVRTLDRCCGQALGTQKPPFCRP
jgi:hypothetical protein